MGNDLKNPNETHYSGNVSYSDLAPRSPADVVPDQGPRAEGRLVGRRATSQPVQPHSQPTSPTLWQNFKAIAKEYFGRLPAGIAISEQDAPAFASFAEVLAREGVPAKAGAGIAAWYQNLVQQQEAADRRELQAQRTECERAMRNEWGQNYAANRSRIAFMIDTLTPSSEVADAIFVARMPDGTLFGDNLGVARWLLKLADIADNSDTAESPSAAIAAGRVLPRAATGHAPAAPDESEIKAIEKLMGNHGSAYWTGPGADAMQQRYRTLIEQRDAVR